ncbi:MAG TPA: LPS export ABC transporter permease LptG [Paracoccaceae bacterium]|nr:LPS export ABC transporter permease LptG [Paracoccaceae bacterium]HMO71604.1 LPS export ABC transporter permease LptG [Paracoccaceae bacterium]
MTLSLYIAGRFLRVLAQVFLVFLGILMLIDIVDQLRRLAPQGLGLAQATELAALNVPASLYRILPLIFILAAIAMFLALARSSELVVIRAAGRSALRFLVAPVLASLAVGVLAVAMLNPLVAALTREYETLHARYARGAESVLSVSSSGLWLRQGGAEGQTVIQAARTDLDGTRLYGVTLLVLGPDGLPERRIEAEEALLIPGAWRLTGARIWDLTAENPEVGRIAQDQATLPSDLTRERIRASFGTPSSIPIWDLPAYIDRIEAAGFTARAHRVWFQMELALPLLLTGMVLVAAGFTMRHARFGRTGTYVLMAILAGFALFFLRNFAQVLGENGQIPVAMAAWTPPVAAILGALGLLLHVEDG